MIGADLERTVRVGLDGCHLRHDAHQLQYAPLALCLQADLVALQNNQADELEHEHANDAKGSPPDYLITDDDLNLGPLALECQRCYAEGP